MRLNRFLMDPAPESGGGSETEKPAEKPAETRAATVVEGVTLSIRQYEELRSRAAVGDAAESEKARLAEEARQAALAAAKAKGDADEAVRLASEDFKRQLDGVTTARADAERRASEAESLALSTACQAAISEAIAPRNLIGADQVDMVRRLLSDRVEARRQPDGTVKVFERGSDKDARTSLAELLSSPSYAIFHKPTTTGGTVNNGGNAAGTGSKVSESAGTTVYGDQPFYTGGRDSLDYSRLNRN